MTDPAVLDRHTHQLTIVAQPICPLPAELTGELGNLVATWQRLIGDVPVGGGDGDTEDWVEMAYRLHAAVTSYPPHSLRVRVPVYGLTYRWVDATTGEDLPAPTTELPDVGIVLGHHGREHSSGSEIASDYMLLGTFFARAGRAMEMAGAFTHDDHDIDAAIARLRAGGVGRVFLKARESKMLNLVIEDGQVLRDALGGGDEWTLIRYEGLRDTFLVQEWVPMRFEYRIFVAGGRPVTGAGSIIEHTPLFNDGGAFSPLVRERRDDRAGDHGGPVVCRPDVVARFVEFAGVVAAELAAEAPDLRDYVMDVALGSDGEPLVIELNAFENAGFFACRPSVFFGALAGALHTSP